MVQCDASKEGYGFYCLQKDGKSGGRWTSYETHNHINFLNARSVLCPEILDKQ